MTVAADRGKSIFRKTEKELLRLASERGADAVHGFRTSARRLQTYLEHVVAGDVERPKKLLKILNRIRKAAGKVRDIDVQLEALRSLKVPQEPRRKTQLTHTLLDVRAKHERKLRKLLKKQDVREIQKRLRRAANSLKFDTVRDPLVIAHEMLGSLPVPNSPADEKTLHSYRMVVKRARYAAEFAVKSPERTQLLAQLKRLQDALGSWHDWLTLTHTAMERLGNVHESSLVALLHNVTGVKFRQAVAAVRIAKSETGRVPREVADLRKDARKDVSRDKAASAAA